MGIFDFLFKKRNKKIIRYLSNGAIILDVRTQREYNSGSITGSRHIPLQDLRNHVKTLKALNKPFVVCCASGVRSAKAVKFLNLNNIDALNGGGWESVKRHTDN